MCLVRVGMELPDRPHGRPKDSNSSCLALALRGREAVGTAPCGLEEVITLVSVIQLMPL